jgi:hypothetical protein
MVVSSLGMAPPNAAGPGRVKDRRLRRPLDCLDTAGAGGYRPYCPRRRRPSHPTIQQTRAHAPLPAPRSRLRSRTTQRSQPGAGPSPGPDPGAGSRPRTPGPSIIGSTEHHADWPLVNAEHAHGCQALIRDRLPGPGPGPAPEPDGGGPPTGSLRSPCTLSPPGRRVPVPRVTTLTTRRVDRYARRRGWLWRRVRGAGRLLHSSSTNSRR